MNDERCISSPRAVQAVSIAPQRPTQLFGRSAMRHSFQSIADDIEANVIALRGARGVVAVVGLDALFSSQTFEAAVLERLDEFGSSQLEAIVYVASHTHNAPALDPTKPLLGASDPDHLRDVATRVAAAIATAVRSLAGETWVQRGAGECRMNAYRRKRGWRIARRRPFLVRTIIGAPVHRVGDSHDLEVLVARDGAGAPLWAIWTWRCHATSFPDTLAVSADFPGHVRQVLRARLGAPGMPVVFLPGFCGDIRPDPSIFPISLKSLVASPGVRPFARATNRNYLRLCVALERAIEDALAASGPKGALAPARIVQAGVPLRRLIVGGAYADSIGDMDIRAIDAGPLGLVLVGAEVCSSYAAKGSSFFPSHWLMSGYCGHVFGYLPDDAQIAEGGYEAEGFFRPFGLDGKFADRIEGKVLDAMRSVGGLVSTND